MLLLYSNADIGPTHFDHSSLNLKQLLAPIMKCMGPYQMSLFNDVSVEDLDYIVPLILL